jgi:hypothetical protein
MLVEASTLARSAVEAVAQAVLFLRRSDAAEAWLAGKRHSPGDVRKALPDLDFKTIYDSLSTVAHPNPEARWTHSVPVPEELEELGYAIAYGGSFQPRNALGILLVLTRLTLIYLNAFFDHYSGRLSVQFWPFMLEVGEEWIKAMAAHGSSLPNDWDALVKHVAGKPLAPMSLPNVPAEMLEKLASIRSTKRGEPTSGPAAGASPSD